MDFGVPRWNRGLIFAVPGKPNELFTVEGYKKELCKAYNRITLYLASCKDVKAFEASKNSDFEDDIEFVDNVNKSESLVPNDEMLNEQVPSTHDSTQDSLNYINSDVKLNTLREIFPERDEESLKVAIHSTSNLEEAVQMIAEDNSEPIYTSYANMCGEDINESDDLILTPECFFATDKTVYCQNEDLQLQALLSEHAKKYANDEEYIRMKVRRYWLYR